MLKKVSTLLFLFALCMWAADFWATKPFTDWSDQEAMKVLTDSPWVGKITISSGSPPALAGGFRSGSDGRGGAGRPGDGPQRDDTRYALETAPFPFAGSPVTMTLLWRTALPVKQALVKHPFAAVAGTSPDAAPPFSDRQEQFYVLVLSSVPRNLLAAAQSDKKAGLLDITTLTAGGKPPLKAVDVQVGSGFAGVETVTFLFPKTTTFTAGDKDLEFSTKFDKTAVKHKFKLKDMVVNGKVEM